MRGASVSMRSPLRNLSLSVLVLALVLAGCAAPGGRSSPPPAAAQADPSPATADAVADAVLHGQLVWPEGRQPEAGSRARLTLAHRFETRAALAEIEFDLAGAPPHALQVPFVRAAVGDATLYRLDVSVFDADGRLRWVSDGEHPVNLDREADPTRVVLMAVDTAARVDVQLDCDGFAASARGVDPDLQIDEQGRSHRLRRAHAASGIRYIGADAELWMHADEARLQIAGTMHRCVVTGGR